MARIPHGILLYSGVPQRQRQRNADFLSRLPLPASEDARSDRSRLTPSDEERIYLMRGR